MRRSIFEFFGTMFLVLAYSLTESPLAIGAMLMVLVYLGAQISGSHYNPAVTLAVWMRGKIKTRMMCCYMGSQVAGGLLAAIIYWFIAGKRYYPVPAAWVADWKMFTIELLFTFFFCYVFLTIMTSKKFNRNSIYGLVVGFALLSILFLGATFNPAVTVGPAVFDALFMGDAFRYIPAHLLGSLAGGGLAGFAYQFLNVDQAQAK